MYILVRQPYDVVGQLRYAVLVKPVGAVDYHLIGLIAPQILEAHLLISALETHVDGVEACVLHSLDRLLCENVKADIAGAGQSDLFFIHVDKAVEPVGKHVEYRVAEVDELYLRMAREQRFQIQYRILGRTEACVNLLVRIDLTEVSVSAVGAVIKTAAADDDYRGADL